MAHESFEDEATAAYLNEHFVSIKVDREERPDVDAVYMDATTAMTGHGGWPMTVRARPRRQPVLRRHLLPRPAAARAAGVPAGARGAGRRLAAPSPTTSSAWPASCASTWASTTRAAAGRRRPRRRWRSAVAPLERRVRRGPRRLRRRAQVPAVDGAGVPAPDGGAATRRMLGGTLEAMARGGIYDQLGGGFARYCVDADWVVPHFEKMLYDNALLLGLYARLGAPTWAIGSPAETADFLLRELRTAEGGFASALDADSEGVEGKFYAWTPAQLVEALGPDDGAWAAPACFESPTAGTFEHGSSTLQLREDPEDLERCVRRTAPAARRARRSGSGRPATTRSSPPGTGWRSAGSATPGCGSASRRTSTPRSPPASCCARVHVVDGRLRRVSRDGVVGAPAGVLEDHGCVAVRLPRPRSRRPATRSGSTARRRAARRRARALPRRRRRLLRHRRRRRGAGRPAARPRRQRVARRASPSMMHALVDATRAHRARAATATPPRRRWRTVATAGRAGAAVRRLVARRRRRRCCDGPLEVAVVGPARRGRATRSRCRARAAPRSGGGGRGRAASTTSRCWPAGRRSTAAPAAYVCRGFVCERPVTDRRRPWTGH